MLINLIQPPISRRLRGDRMTRGKGNFPDNTRLARELLFVSPPITLQSQKSEDGSDFWDCKVKVFSVTFLIYNLG